MVLGVSIKFQILRFEEVFLDGILPECFGNSQDSQEILFLSLSLKLFRHNFSDSVWNHLRLEDM